MVILVSAVAVAIVAIVAPNQTARMAALAGAPVVSMLLAAAASARRDVAANSEPSQIVPTIATRPLIAPTHPIGRGDAAPRGWPRVWSGKAEIDLPGQALSASHWASSHQL